jgi:hypothetical protein
MEASGVGEGSEIFISREQSNAPVDTGLSHQRVSESRFAMHRQYFRPQQTGALPIARGGVNHRNLGEGCGKVGRTATSEAVQLLGQ